MTEVSKIRERKGIGDSAVDGLLGGVVAGSGMAAYLGVAAISRRENPQSR